MIVETYTISQLLKIIDQVPEFDRAKNERESEYRERIDTRDPLILVSITDQMPSGFLVAFDKYQDGSYYCWRVGVLPDFRRQGILSSLIDTYTRIAEEKGYSKLKFITRNSCRGMLSFAIKHNWNIVEVLPKEEIDDFRILFEKEI